MSIFEWENIVDEYGTYKKRTNEFGIVETLIVSRTQKWHDENPLVEPEPQPPTIEEQLAQKDKEIIELKKLQSVTSAVLSELNETQQDMIEIIMEMGNV